VAGLKQRELLQGGVVGKRLGSNGLEQWWANYGPRGHFDRPAGQSHVHR